LFTCASLNPARCDLSHSSWSGVVHFRRVILENRRVNLNKVECTANKRVIEKEGRISPICFFYSW
jgi:hypothetical protein